MNDLLAKLDDFAERHDANVVIERAGGRRTHHWDVAISLAGTLVARTMNASLREAVERALLDSGAL